MYARTSSLPAGSPSTSTWSSVDGRPVKFGEPLISNLYRKTLHHEEPSQFTTNRKQDLLILDKNKNGNYFSTTMSRVLICYDV